MINLLKNIKVWLITKYCNLKATQKSKSMFPDDLDIDLKDLINGTRPIKVTIIDNNPFPWTEALSSINCRVNYHADYTKPIIQKNQKIKTVSADSSDIIICDIHDVGGLIYPGIEGIGVIENLRKNYPFHIIVAYTGNPGRIARDLKNPNTIDAVFAKDWLLNDFLLNFEHILKSLYRPSHRWEFIRRRLKFLEVEDKKITEIQNMFVKNVLLSQLLKQKFNFSASETKRLVLSSANDLNIPAILKIGMSAAEVLNLISPFILEANK